MNLRVYNAKDKLKETIDAMTYVQTEKELDKLFVSVCGELLSYDIELRKEIECDRMNCTDSKAILNSVYGVRNINNITKG